MSLSKTPYRGNRKAYVLLGEARALKLLKATHIKIGWVSCRVRRKKAVNRCFRCLCFGHIAVDCRGPDRSRCCWKCKEERLTSPEDGSHPEVIPNGGSGVGFHGLETGREF